MSDGTRDSDGHVDFDVAIGAHQQNWVRGRKTRDVTQHAEGTAVRPVQVIEQQHQRRVLRDGDEELSRRVEQAKALLVGLQRHRFADIWEAFPQRRDEPRQRRRAHPEIARQLRGVGRANVR